MYRRLLENSVFEIRGFAIPKLIDHSDQLWVIEMQIVSPPFILDFASGYVDQRPPYTLEEAEEWEEEQRESFGENWDDVQSIMAVFRRYGIHLADLNPRNFNFGTLDRN